jgi:hypothetical protein
MAFKLTGLFVLLFAFTSMASGQSAFDGKWTGEVIRPAPNTNQNLTITLKLDNGKISGSIIGADPGETPIDWGFIKGDLITFKTKMTVANTLQTMVYVGSHSAAVLKTLRLANWWNLPRRKPNNRATD